MRRSLGFTLTEMLVAVTVLAVLLMIATPHFKTLIERNQVVTTANDLIAALLTARSEAINQEATVTLTSVDWASASWTVVDADNELIVYHGPSETVSITPHGRLAAVSYLSSGRASGAALTNADYFNVESGATARKVCMSGIGRPFIVSEGDCP